MIAELRLAQAIAREGRTVDIAGSPEVGLVSIMSPELALTYLTKSEYDAAVRPVRGLCLTAAVTVAEGDAVTILGDSFSVLRLEPLVLRDEIIGHLAVLG